MESKTSQSLIINSYNPKFKGINHFFIISVKFHTLLINYIIIKKKRNLY